MPKLCECGCGELAPISTQNRPADGHIKGQPVRFIHGHRARLNIIPVRDRLVAKAEPAHDLSPNGMAGCLIWTDRLNEAGYGKVTMEDGFQARAHRIAWLLSGRTIPEGMVLDHLCRRPSCINVDHLEPVTNAENSRRGAKAKINMEQADEIRLLRREGWLAKDIAAAYGLATDSVYGISYGKRWAS
jgi:hypothetical protein